MRYIQVDPASVIKISNNIALAQRDYRRLYNELYNQIDRLSESWQGKDNRAFINQIEGFQDNFRIISVIMSQYSDFLKNAISAYENTQNELYEQASRLRA